MDGSGGLDAAPTRSRRWLWAIVALAGLGGAMWVARRRAAAVFVDRPVATLDTRYRGISPEDHDAACVALREFATTYTATINTRKPKRDSEGTTAAVLALWALRETVLKHLYALVRATPNDLHAHVALTQHTEDIDVVMKGLIENVQRHTGHTLLFPGPLDDWFYRRYYRAANDTIE